MKNRSLIPILILLNIFSVTIDDQCWAYDNKTVHRKINEAAVNPNYSIANDYLKNQLGLPGGIDANINEHPISFWISNGGEYEDFPFWRVVHHFHDPTYNAANWNSAGFGVWSSALVWSQDSFQSFFGTYSWLTARDSFYTALTTGSETEYAKSFRSLGQVMHLVSDMAVPAHVRADSHLTIKYLLKGDPYEWYTEKNVNSLQIGSMAPVPVDMSIFNQAVGGSDAPVPISALFDRDVCNNSLSNPSCNWLSLWTNNPGLAEFTNANFFSKDTFGEYAYPDFQDSDVEIQWHDRPTVTAEDQKEDRPVYIERSVNGQPRFKLASAHYFTAEADMGLIASTRMTLDEATYKDYANQLIPRAIGYSTALLDYFFRGTIEISQPLDGAYSVSTDPSQGFATIKLSASNTSPVGEDLINGPIKLVVKFKTALNNTFEGEMPVFDANAGFTYLVADEAKSITSILRSTDPDSPTLLTFNLPSNIPLSATDLQLYLVYKGTIGNETDGIAVGYKKIGEPTAFDVINSMDWVCINNAWYQTGLDAHILSDRDNNGFPDFDAFPHHIFSLNISLTSGGTTATPTETTRDLHYENLATGSIARNYILVDQQFTVNVGNLIYTPDMAEDTMWDHSQPINGSIPGPHTAVSIQENPTDGRYTNDGWEPFRGITTHNALTIMMGEDTCNYNDSALPSLIFTPSINQQ